MAIALHDPDAGYYASRDPFGAAGDFVTAPEISQIFGELIGACVVDFWQRIGRPDPVILAELGPGRGTLMADLLRGSRAAPDFRRGAAASSRRGQPGIARRRSSAALPPPSPTSRRVSPTASTRCRTGRCCSSPTSSSTRCRFGSWCAAGTGGPSASLGSITAGNRKGAPDPRRGTGKSCPRLLVPPGLRYAPPGAVVEICPAAAALAASLGERLARSPGMALFIDYGYFSAGPARRWPRYAAIERCRSSNARRGRSERPCRFRGCRRGGGGFRRHVHGPVTQRDFLLALGAEARLRRCAPCEPGAACRAGKRSRALDRSGADGQFVQGAGADLAGPADSRRACAAPSL